MRASIALISLEKTGKFGRCWRVDRGGGADVVGGEVSIGCAGPSEEESDARSTYIRLVAGSGG